MLTATFCHIPGIGYATERKLWAQQILSWNDLLLCPHIVPRLSSHEIRCRIEDSIEALSDNPAFFTRTLKRRDSWRLFPHFREKTAYLDIETTGLGWDAEITTITLYDGYQVRAYINGKNLQTFIDDIEDYQVLVTYNGLIFDIPCIERFFTTRIRQAQIDLRYVLGALGCRGGLKGCERFFGINRALLDGVDGAGAVILWQEYQQYKSEAALETLLAYNREDTVNLERLLVEAYNRNIDQTPFRNDGFLPLPEPPPPVCHPDHAIINRIRRRYG
ncbi:MAG: exonuclease [Proteobacteria bacterium]|nr:MAG: exonuclease [Pseudomonadota bacterium]